MKMNYSLFTCIFVLFYALSGLAGEADARKYFARGLAKQSASSSGGSAQASGGSEASTGDHFMMLHLAGFTEDKAFEWGPQSSEESVTKLNFGVTYRLGEWENSMDYMWRFDITSYSVSGKDPLKFSVLPLIVFPEVSSRFPLYFGVGAGLGVFFKQAFDESALTLEYTLFAGGRVLNVYESLGFFVEAGLRNHVFLLSEGQHNGLYVSVGTNFIF